MRTLPILAFTIAALGAAAVGCSGSATVTVDPGATLTVENRSDFSITEIRVTSVGSSTWGPNLIGGDVLLPGESLTLSVGCNTYDALLVDEDGVDCELHSVNLCLNDANWVIRNNTCSVFGAFRAAKEAAEKAGSAAPEPNQ